MANDTNAIFKFIKDMMSDDDDEVKKRRRGVIPGLGDALNYAQPEEVNYNRTRAVPAVASQAQTTLKPVANTVPQIIKVPPVSEELSGEGNSSGVPTELPNVPVPNTSPNVKDSPKKGPSFLDKALASAGLPSVDSIKDSASAGLPSTADEAGRELALQLGLPSKFITEGVKKGSDLTARGLEAVADPLLRFGQGFMGRDPTGVEDGSFGRYYPEKVVPEKELETEIPKVPVDPTAAGLIPNPEAVTTTAVEPEVELKVDPEPEVIPDPEVIPEPEVTLPTAVTEEVDKNLRDSEIDGEGNEVLEVSVDEAKEDPTFFGKLWDSVKDIAKQGYEDPALRKALFAYTASKVLGGDGVSFGAAVLENEWKVQAAKAKADSDQAIASGKVKATASAKLADDLSPDFGSGVTLFDNSTRQEVKGVKSKDNSRFFPSNVAPFLELYPDLKQGGSVPMSALIGSNAFAFDGETQDGAIQRLVVEAQTTAKSAVEGIATQLQADPDMKEGKKKLLIDQLTNSTERNNIIQSVSSFVNGFPANTDFITNKSVVEGMITRGMQDWVNTVARGGAKNNKDIASFLDFQKLKYDITDKGIPSSFFQVTGKPNEEIGQNAWAKVRVNAKTFNSVLNSKLKEAGLAQSDFTNGNVYKHLHRAYSSAMLTGRAGIKEHWESRSEASSDNKAEQLSPALLWVNSMFTKSKSEKSYLAGSPSDVADSIVESIKAAKALLTKK